MMYVKHVRVIGTICAIDLGVGKVCIDVMTRWCSLN